MRKSFKDNIRGADKLFSINDAVNNDSSDKQDSKDAENMKDMKDMQDMQDMHSVKDAKNIQIEKRRKEYYRLNLKLDLELKEYITESAWQERVTVTEYLSNLIKADKEKRKARIKNTQNTQNT